MTITLPLKPQEEARLNALAQAKGLSPGALVRKVLERILTEEIGDDASKSGAHSGDELVAAMQASPYQEINIEPSRHRLPVRDVTF